MSMPQAEKLRRHPGRTWTREQWGDRGRPVHLINHPSYDRSAWWAVAAQLAADHTVTVFDLPGHGDSGDLADDLAEFTARSGTLAPVVVGQGSAALVAAVFAASYLAHGVVGIEHYLDTADAREVTAGPNAIRCPYLAVFAQPPRRGYAAWLEERMPKARCEVYGTPGAFPNLSEVDRFAEDLRAIAA
jgi:pimeloyl-ACP methyl ester carboxylesterase